MTCSHPTGRSQSANACINILTISHKAGLDVVRHDAINVSAELSRKEWNYLMCAEKTVAL